MVVGARSTVLAAKTNRRSLHAGSSGFPHTRRAITNVPQAQEDKQAPPTKTCP